MVTSYGTEVGSSGLVALVLAVDVTVRGVFVAGVIGSCDICCRRHGEINGSRW